MGSTVVRRSMAMWMMLTLALWAPVGWADELVLVANGVAQAPIVIFADAPPRTRRTADELAEYIERVSGVRPAVIEGLPDPVPASAIWIGFQPQVKALFPDVDFEFKHPEEILIAANGRHLVIAGRDRWDTDSLRVETRRASFDGIQQEYGTVNAVYTFIQDHLNVRWLWPGELGIDVVKRETITFKPFVYRYHPQVRARGGMLNYSSALQKRGYGISSDWSRLQRLQLDSLELNAGHPFSRWWDLHHKEHPEFFALQPDGTRSGFPNPRTVKICKSNPAVWDQWMKDVEEQLEGNPNQRVFSAAINDGWASGYCICENCRAWDNPDAELRRFSWQGVSQDYVAMSDRQVTFSNTLARMLKARYPNRDYFVSMLAYGHSLPAPVEARPDDNVIIINVGNFLGRRNLKDESSPTGMLRRDQFIAWAKVAKHIMWRPNTGSPAGWQQGLPDVSIEQTIEDLALAAKHGFTGMFIDMVWEHWATQGPMYYVMAQLLWDPSKDGHAVLADYYHRGFGPAAEMIEAYWKLMDQTRTAYTDEYGYGNRSRQPEFYKDVMVEAESLLDAAAAQAAQGPEIYRERVTFVRLGLEWTKLVFENMVLMRQVNETKDKQGEAAQKVRANWVKMLEIAESDKYPTAINKGPTRPQAMHLRSLHPDY